MPLLSDILADLYCYTNAGKRRENTKLVLIYTALTSRGFWILAFHRAQYAAHSKYRGNRNPFARFLLLLCTLGEYLITIIAKTMLLPSLILSPGVFLSNKGYMIIGAKKIGSGCVIHNNITIGMDIKSGVDFLPCIEDNVWIGSNCVIFGNITIGAGSTICENTVLSRSIPPNCVVKGNPAKVIARDFDNSPLISNPLLSSSALFGS